MRSVRIAAVFLFCVCCFPTFASAGVLRYPKVNTMILLRTDDEKMGMSIFKQLGKEGFQMSLIAPPSMGVGYLSVEDENKIREKFGEAIEYIAHDEVDPVMFERRGFWIVGCVKAWNNIYTEAGWKKWTSGPPTAGKDVPLAPVDDFVVPSSREMQEAWWIRNKDSRILPLMEGDLFHPYLGKREIEDDEVCLALPDRMVIGRIEVSADSGFSMPVISTVCLGGIVVPKSVLKRTSAHFWRYREENLAQPFGVTRISAWSEVESLEVKDWTGDVLDADGNIKKSDVGTPNQISPGNNGTIRQEDVCIKWGQVAGAKFYRVQIGEDKRFRNMFIDRFFRADKVEAAGSDQACVDAGVSGIFGSKRTYHWRVSAIGEDGREKRSAVRSFRVNAP